MLLVALAVHLPTLDQPLLEHNEFRQTQTAYAALSYHLDGIDLMHTPIPTLGPPFDIPVELPLYQALASLVMDVGVAPDTAMRATALATFLLTAVLLWLLARRTAGEVAAHLTLLAFLFMPLNLLWSRA